MLGHSFQTQSQQTGVPECFDQYHSNFQQSVQRPAGNEWVSLIPMILAQNSKNDKDDKFQNMWQMIMAQQLLNNIHDLHKEQQSSSHDSSGSGHSSGHESNGDSTKDDMIKLLTQLVQQNQQHPHYEDDGHGHQVPVAIDNSAILALLTKLVEQTSHDEGASHGNANGGGVDIASLIQLMSHLSAGGATTDTPDPKSAVLPVVVGTEQGSMYDALLTYLNHQLLNDSGPKMDPITEEVSPGDTTQIIADSVGITNHNEENTKQDLSSTNQDILQSLMNEITSSTSSTSTQSSKDALTIGTNPNEEFDADDLLKRLLGQTSISDGTGDSGPALSADDSQNTLEALLSQQDK